ncbi:MAG: DUF1801 domain-containing protein [Saprospiraceae bacterium]|jgi:hypothetical protein|nr:DUF1801 domain-containing protein [Candidatus Parvibacillus calidus]MBX2937974.1 DUF1801 domain-containing protein [Saprospiraceae bacterium]MBX7180241.1 DUF1801 domain-containing protein [Saprospiraceae bacterium]MCB0589776.1 DUF1801 domain-containing protein [Saprospiraceae bacterium]MCO5282100.1 DUF1801 domain-containing protein [Saprospiraceae bacterium]
MRPLEKTIQEILDNIPTERKEAFHRLHHVIVDNLPEGFEVGISYGMLGYVVPHSIYPAGYHCKKEEPLPFASLASQKNSINFYHMGIYADPGLLEWFVTEYPKYCKSKLDMGKSCIRFKKPDDIPFGLIGALMRKMTVAQWINTYETAFRKK